MQNLWGMRIFKTEFHNRRKPVKEVVTDDSREETGTPTTNFTAAAPWHTLTPK